MLNINKDYVDNSDQFTSQTAIPTDKFLYLLNLVLTTTCTLLTLIFTNKLLALQQEDQHLQPQQKFICWLINKQLSKLISNFLT